MAGDSRDPNTVRMGARRADGERTGRRRWREAGDLVSSELPALRPRDVGELLDVAIDILIARPFMFLAFGSLTWLPFRIAHSGLGLRRALMSDDPATFGSAMALSSMFTMMAQTIVSALVALWVYASIQGIELRAGKALPYLLKISFSLVFLTLLSSLATVLGTCAGCVPGIYLLWKLYLAPPVLVLEEGGLGDALRRSFFLTRGSFGRWLGLFVITQVLVWPLTGAIEGAELYVTDAEGLSIPENLLEVGLTLVSTLFFGLASALIGIVISVFYLDARVRQEGHDLRMRLERFEEHARGPAIPKPAPKADS